MVRDRSAENRIEIPPAMIRAVAKFLENYYDESPSCSESTARRLLVRGVEEARIIGYKFALSVGTDRQSVS